MPSTPRLRPTPRRASWSPSGMASAATSLPSSTTQRPTKCTASTAADARPLAKPGTRYAAAQVGEPCVASLGLSGPKTRAGVASLDMPAAVQLLAKLNGATTIPAYGPLPVSVPGCVDAWFMLHEVRRRAPVRALAIRSPACARARTDGDLVCGEEAGAATAASVLGPCPWRICWRRRSPMRATAFPLDWWWRAHGKSALCRASVPPHPAGPKQSGNPPGRRTLCIFIAPPRPRRSQCYQQLRVRERAAAAHQQRRLPRRL